MVLVEVQPTWHEGGPVLENGEEPSPVDVTNRESSKGRFSFYQAQLWDIGVEVVMGGLRQGVHD